MAWRWPGEPLRRRATAARLATASAFMVVYLLLDATVADAVPLAPVAAIPIAAYGLLLGLRGGLLMTVVHIVLAQAVDEPEAPRDFMDGVVGWVIATGLGAATGWVTETMGRERRQAAQLEASQASLLQTVAALKQSEERFRLAAAATQDVMWDWDLVADTVVWGDSIEQAFGYRVSGPQPGTSSWTDHIHPDDREAAVGSLKQAIAVGESNWKAEYRFQRNDGSWATVLDRGSILRDEGGNALRAVGAMTDLTQVREAQARLAEKEAETKRLKEQAAFKTQFLNNAAHELGTPLTPIKLQMASLRRSIFGELTPKQAEAVGLIDRNLERLSLLVGDLLDAARLQSGRLRVLSRPLSPAALVTDVVDSFAEKARVQGVSLASRGLATAAQVVGDESRLNQVLVNLVHNAIKFTPRGGRVEVSVQAEGGELVLSVSDTGLGMTEEQMARLFQPFTQVHDTTKHSLGGTGLGLYISKGIVEQHDGRLLCSSEGPGKGTTFEVRLPLARAGHAVPPTEALGPAARSGSA
jgi:PAS domain S-box-containing protein